MFEGIYKNVLNQQAFQVLPNRIDVPDYRLGVGNAESTAPHPLVLRVNPPAPTVKEPLIKTDDTLITAGLGENKTVMDFPQTGYLGEALGVF